MRLIAVLMAVLVLVFSCMPCADIAAMPNTDVNNSMTIILQDTGIGHQDQHEDGDLCSPFCHCACCAGFTLIFDTVSVPLRIETAESIVYSAYLSDEVIEISLPIWQPPQLV